MFCRELTLNEIKVKRDVATIGFLETGTNSYYMLDTPEMRENFHKFCEKLMEFVGVDTQSDLSGKKIRIFYDTRDLQTGIERGYGSCTADCFILTEFRNEPQEMTKEQMIAYVTSHRLYAK